jgi:hypothetical protein
MKLRAVAFAVAAAFCLTAGPSLAMKVRPWGKHVAGRDPDAVWARIRENPEITRVKGVLASHRTWVRNNVLQGGDYVADKAEIHVTPQDSYFDVNVVNPGRVASPLADASWLFLWRYADVDQEWGRAKAGDPVTKGSVVVNEGEGQLRFPIYIGPRGRFHEVRLVSYKGKTLLYVMEPGTDRYSEEWILQ